MYSSDPRSALEKFLFLFGRGFFQAFSLCSARPAPGATLASDLGEWNSQRYIPVLAFIRGVVDFRGGNGVFALYAM